MKKIMAFLCITLLWCTGLAYGAEGVLLGLIPEQNVFKQRERYEPMGRYLTAKVGVPVDFTMLSRYGNILNSFRDGNLDGAFWGSFTGALAIKQLGLVPLARPVWNDGTSTYHGLILVRREGPVQSIEELKGKRFAFVDRATTAGFIFPLAVFDRHGMGNLEESLASYFYAGSHDAAIAAVLNGEADGGAAKNTIYQQMAKEDPSILRKLRILDESDRMPSNALGVRSDLDPALRAKLAEALLTMDRDPEGIRVLQAFGAQKFIETSLADYAPVFRLAGEAKIDLAKYQYVNR